MLLSTLCGVFVEPSFSMGKSDSGLAALPARLNENGVDFDVESKAHEHAQRLER